MLKYIIFSFLILSSALLSAQCYADRHNTSLNSSWLSCSSTNNPNPDRPRGYWLMYELEERQAVRSVKVWNINHPDHLRSGVKTIEIDYQNPDGSWTSHSINEIEQAEASGFYEGEELVLPGEFVTNKILLNFTENYGGSCRGLAEVRLGLVNKTTSTYDIAADHFDVTISPNPFAEFAQVTVKELEQSTIRYELVNHIGQIIRSKEVSTQNGESNFTIIGEGLTSGTYYLKIIDGNRLSSRKLSIHTK